MTPDDAIGVARCTYAVYGYSVPDEYLYFPDRMREMLQVTAASLFISEARLLK